MDSTLGEMTMRPAASDKQIRECEERLGIVLPEGYRQFLKRSNGGEGFVGPNAYAMFWSVEELHSMNQGYEVEKYLVGGLLFGSDGGGEAYGFDLRNPKSSIVQVPFVGMGWSDALVLGGSFDSFLEKLAGTTT